MSPALRTRSAVEVAHDVMADLNATARERVLAEAVHERVEYLEGRVREAELNASNSEDALERGREESGSLRRQLREVDKEADAVQRRLDEADELLEEAEALFGHSHNAAVGEWLAQFRLWRTERAAATE